MNLLELCSTKVYDSPAAQFLLLPTLLRYLGCEENTLFFQAFTALEKARATTPDEIFKRKITLVLYRVTF